MVPLQDPLRIHGATNNDRLSFPYPPRSVTMGETWIPRLSVNRNTLEQC